MSNFYNKKFKGSGSYSHRSKIPFVCTKGNLA